MSEAQRGSPAAELFEVDVVDAPRRGRITRGLLALVVGLVTLGSTPANAGGRRIRILGRTSRMEIAAWREPVADHAHELLGRIRADLVELDAETFARRWIEGTAPRE